jgi:16S rRNA (guanine(966)-N(2))-methyltransferase RsmD
MRIISGVHGGRRIDPPAKMPYTRPTTDIAKSGLFNILQHQVDFTDLKTLDLFGGTGAISYELASRGATDQTIVEKDPAMADFIQKTAGNLGIPLKLFRMDVFQFLQSTTETYDFIFAGPPYALGNIDDLPRIITGQGLLKPGGWFVLEHTPRNDYKTFDMYRSERSYGTTVFSFFINKG